MTDQPPRRRVAKVVAYVVRDDRLLVFTHDLVPIEVAGVQVPAGTIEPDESPADAVVREVLEETRIAARVIGELGVEDYDVWPSKAEMHEHHFFQLEPVDSELPERWAAGEGAPSGGGRQRCGPVGGFRWSTLTCSTPSSVPPA